MSLSLMAIMGIQNPTRHEKYVIEECIKIIRYNKYLEDDTTPMMRTCNKTLDGIIKNLKKVLACPIREDRVMIAVCEPIKSVRHCRCVEIPKK